MSSLQILATGSIIVISTWSAWAIFNYRVRDGIVGKLIYSVIALAGYALVVRGELPWIAPTAGTTFLLGLACAGLRHIFIVTYWARVQSWICRHLNCEHCLSDPRFGTEPGKQERRKS